MRIICYTDFAESTRGAATLAMELAARTHDSVLLVHPAKITGGGRRANSGPTSESADDNAEGRRHEEIQRLSGSGIMVKTAPLANSPGKAVAEVALAAWTRLIVVAAPADAVSGGWGHAGLAERIAESAPVPTLVVRTSEPLIEWARGERTLRVLCTYDFSATGDAALSYLKEFQCLGRCDVVVAHVARLAEERARLGIRSPMCLDGHEPQVQCILERELRERVDAILGADAGARIRCKGSWGRPDFDLVDLAKQEQVDLVITGTHQRRGLGRLFHFSSSRFLLRRAPMNMLAVPATKPAGHGVVGPPRRILAATDFSEAGNQAVRHSCAIVPADGTIRLLHVAPPRAVLHVESERCIGDTPARAHHAKHLNACTQRLHSLVSEQAAVRGIVTEVEVAEHRDPAVGIMQAAERFGAELICVGTRQRTVLSAAIARPIARRIMAKSKRPMLVVHPPAR